MPSRKDGSFGNLGLTAPQLTAPQPLSPLPDDTDDQVPAAAVTPEPEGLPARAPAPRRVARQARTSAPVPERPRAATTVRLRPSAAEPLNEAWLAERQATDPKLSYPEFASRIVQLGLAAYEKQQRRSA